MPSGTLSTGVPKVSYMTAFRTIPRNQNSSLSLFSTAVAQLISGLPCGTLSTGGIDALWYAFDWCA